MYDEGFDMRQRWSAIAEFILEGGTPFTDDEDESLTPQQRGRKYDKEWGTGLRELRKQILNADWSQHKAEREKNKVLEDLPAAGQMVMAINKSQNLHFEVGCSVGLGLGTKLIGNLRDLQAPQEAKDHAMYIKLYGGAAAALEQLAALGDGVRVPEVVKAREILSQAIAGAEELAGLTGPEP